ncbi:MAG: glycoside hydrolase family 3 C-terminal domain-containing protein [Erysipelotrichaceae bacterium]|nr:glycoside hydrolase family 3 C-terminal domain-containing protein [Erysipelotrichaceae bacterium]
MGINYWIAKVANIKPKKALYPEHMEYVRKNAAEGMVLLKNGNDILPLKQNSVALFGAGSVDTVFCGSGSGYANAPYTVNCYEGLKNTGFSITSEEWIRRFKKESEKANRKDKTLGLLDVVWGGGKVYVDDLLITDDELNKARETDTVIYVIRRNAGEGADRKLEKGDYYLTDNEAKNLDTVCKNFRNVILVLNTFVIDTKFITERKDIDAVLLMSYNGNEEGNTLADILTGKSVPTGRLADSWAVDYEDNPASATFGSNDGNPFQKDYNEDIYVGYRYFDSFNIKPMIPFGYGLGYGRFEMKCLSVKADWNTAELQVNVKNVGDHPDKEVVQVYVSAPQGKLNKPWQELKGFKKTALLKPGEQETIDISIPMESLASYDSETAAFIMEEGDYVLRVGDHSRHTVEAGVIHVKGTGELRKVVSRLAPDHPLETLTATEMTEPVDYGFKEYYDHTEIVKNEVFEAELNSKDCVTANGYNPWYTRTDQQHASIIKAENSTFGDVVAGKVSLESFVASLPEEVLFRLVAGDASESPYPVTSRNPGKLKEVKAPKSSGATTKQYLKTLGIPQWTMTDGPAGLHIMGGVTCNPVGMALAQSWNTEFCQNIGAGIGRELKALNTSVILGPGMNIHRDPLCGRNFEYFSEDPLVSGKMAAAYTIGVQETDGTAVAIKHFAGNNQETERFKQNDTVSERALREIYLKGFEICIREADPKTVMTSYNLINGKHTSSNKELVTDILRDEWNFKGLVMTDWGTLSDKDLDLNAGNNLIMGGYRSDYLKAAYEGSEPEFEKNGYVKTRTFKLYGGLFKEEYEQWNSFRLDKEGKDTVSVTVTSGEKLNEKVLKAVEKGCAEIIENDDRSTTVVYKGTRKGKSISRKVLEQNACVVLEQIKDSLSCKLTYSDKKEN